MGAKWIHHDGTTKTKSSHAKARRRKGKQEHCERAPLPLLTAFFFAPWRLCVRRLSACSGWVWSLSAARGSTRLLKKEMKGPQGLGDAGTEAKTERAKFFERRVSELLLSAFADRPPYRRTLGAASRVSNDLPSYGFRMCRVWLKSVGCRDQAETVQIADECTTAAVPDGHSRCNYSHVVDRCQYLLSAGVENFGMATRRHEKAQKRKSIEHKETKGT
jgi:hypothetical protein